MANEVSNNKGTFEWLSNDKIMSLNFKNLYAYEYDIQVRIDLLDTTRKLSDYLSNSNLPILKHCHLRRYDDH